MATAKTHPDNDPIAGEESTGEAIWFYQCSSPDCNLRFPAPAMDGIVCPLCKSEIRKTNLATDYQTGGVPLRQSMDGFSILLDNLRSVYNVGSILRTSDGAGVQHAYLCGITPTPLHRRLSKTALSAEIHTSWSYHPNGVEQVKELKSSGYFIIGLETANNARDLFVEPSIPAKNTILVVGNEICGIDPAIIELCDTIYSLPMLGKKKSLNVAVSFGIAAYHLVFGSSGHKSIIPGNM
jgi:23S rRNA (guanosine2251-2'-O)-methyltransferase